jgi:predicted GH43/DUF377 family glycosyl hydrolase
MKENITLWLNGNEITTLTSSLNSNGTKVGIYLKKSNSPASKPSWTNFKVTEFKGVYISWPQFKEITTSAPAVALGTGGSWEDSDINDPSVAYDSDNTRYVMAYTGYKVGDANVQKMGIAYATNILGPWTKEATNPVLLPDAGDTFNMNGGLVKFGATWYYYYGSSAGGVNISCATSSDLLTWTKQGVVLQGAGGSVWDATSTFDVFARVTQDGLTVQLWYAGSNSNGVQGFGLATSTDGLTFARSSINPIFGVQAFSGGNFGEIDVFVPTGQEGKVYLVTFDGSNYNLAGASATRYLVQALSYNGMKSWHFRTLALSAGTGWESTQVFDPSTIVVGNTLYLFHSGSDTTGSALGLNTQIGIAQAILPSPLELP